MNKKYILISIPLITAAIFFTACAKKEETPNTEVAEIGKDVDTMMEDVKEIKPVSSSMTTGELITAALMKHYGPQFGNTDHPIKSTGYKIYLIEDGNPGEKIAYGFANYSEYVIDNDKVDFTCGSGPTGISITFTTDGKDSKINYEVLTDGDLKSAEFKAAFPESVQEKILARAQSDIDEVYKKEQEMTREQYKAITGTDLTTEIEY